MVPQKASGGGGGGQVESDTTLHVVNIKEWQLVYYKPGVKLDKKLIENGFGGQKCLVVCLFGVVATTLIGLHNIISECGCISL